MGTRGCTVAWAPGASCDAGGPAAACGNTISMTIGVPQGYPFQTFQTFRTLDDLADGNGPGGCTPYREYPDTGAAMTAIAGRQVEPAHAPRGGGTERETV